MFWEMADALAEFFTFMVIALVLLVTLPLWILPYAYLKLRGRL